MKGRLVTLGGCAIILAAIGTCLAAGTGGHRGVTKPSANHDTPEWLSPSNGPYEDVGFFEGSGDTGRSDVDETASGFGPDDEDSDIGSGSSPVDGVIGSSGDHDHDQDAFDYDEYSRTTDVLLPDESTMHVRHSTAESTTEAVPDVDWHVTDLHPTLNTMWPEVPDERIPMGKKPTEDVWRPVSTPSTAESSSVTTLDAITSTTVTENTNIFGSRKHSRLDSFWRPGILAAVIGGSVLGLLAAILLITFVIYRLRKKDEGSYALDESKTPPAYPYAYHKAPTREFYA